MYSTGCTVELSLGFAAEWSLSIYLTNVKKGFIKLYIKNKNLANCLVIVTP